MRRPPLLTFASRFYLSRSRACRRRDGRVVPRASLEGSPRFPSRASVDRCTSLLLFRRRRTSFTKQHSVLGAYSISRLLLLRTPSLASRLAKRHARHHAALPSPSRWREPRRLRARRAVVVAAEMSEPRVPRVASRHCGQLLPVPPDAAAQQGVRALAPRRVPQPLALDQHRLRREHRGFLQRDAGLRGHGGGGRRMRSTQRPGRVQSSRRVSRRRSARLRLVLVLQGRALYGDRELARRARRRGARRPRPRRGRARISRTRSNPIRGRRCGHALPSRGHASNTESVYNLFLEPSSGRGHVRRSRPRPEGPVSVHEDMCEFVCRLCVRHAWPATMIRGGRRAARRRGYRAARDARRRHSDPTFCRTTQVSVRRYIG